MIGHRKFCFGRLLPILMALAIGASARAGGGLFGTKSLPISTTNSETTAGMGAMPIVQMLIALLVVLAMLKWLMPALVKKVGARTSVSGKGIQIQETAVIGAANLYVVQVRGRSLLVGATPNSVSCIADLTEQVRTEPQTFQEMVDSAPARPSFAENPVAEALDQLNRLKRLSS